MISNTPTLAEYTQWINTYMGIPTEALPPDSSVIQDSFTFATEVVNPLLMLVGGNVYTMAVYNFGGHWLVMWAPDQPNSYYPSPPAQPPSTVQAPTNNNGYFFWLRSPSGYNLNAFTPGILEESHDVSTGQRWHVSKQLDNLNLMDLGMMNTPWGRMYLQIAQMWGSDWGMT